VSGLAVGGRRATSAADAYYRYSQQNTRYTTWKLTLYGVPGGTARTEDVTQGQFPRVK